MSPTGRTVLRSVLVAGAAAAAQPCRSNAQSEHARTTLRAVIHAHLRMFRLIWTTANISDYRDAMIYGAWGPRGRNAREPRKLTA